MQPADINHPIYKVIVGVVAIASVLNLWLLQALTQKHCAQLDLRLVKISLGVCPIAQRAPIASQLGQHTQSLSSMNIAAVISALTHLGL